LNAQEIISSGILELYCTGLTSAAENADVQRWAKQYPEVAAEIEAIQAGLEGYAQAHAITPGSSVKEKVFAEINKSSAVPVINLKQRDNGTENVRSISSSWKYAAAASIVLLIGSLIFNYTLYNKYNTVNNDLQLAQNKLSESEKAMLGMKGEIAIMTNPDARHVSLETMDSAKDNAARIYWMKNTGDVYVDPSNLPELPSNKQYQFWAIIDGRPVNGGIITREVNGKKVHVQQMKTFGNAQAFAISVEDAGPEKPVPTEVKAMGKM
jgi:anti-sigma-K factor RskA